MSSVSGSDRFRRLSREGFWVVFGQVMAVLGSLVGVRLLTELLSPAEYGELALGMTLATLVNQVLLGPLANGVTRFYAPAQESGDLGGYLKAVNRMLLLATGIVFIIILFTTASLLISEQSKWLPISIAALIFAILTGYNSILNGIQNAARQRFIVAIHQGMEAWGRFLVAAGLMLWLGASSTIAMVGYIMAIALILGSQYFFLQKTLPRNIIDIDNKGGWQAQIWKYSWPFSIFGVFTWAQLVSDRWALGLFSTTQEIGLYAVLFQLGYYPMSMATGMATQFLAPIFYHRAGDASDNRRNANVNKLSWHFTWLTLGVTGVVFMAVLMLHAQIFWVFVAAEYTSVSHLLPWMLLAGGIFAAGQTRALNLMSLMKTRAMMMAKIVTAILGILLNVAGAYWYGITGVVAASVFFSLSFFCWMILLSK
jgi:O-antigen/teichoic acid export membrane protein